MKGKRFSVGATIHCAPGRAEQCPVSAMRQAGERPHFASLLRSGAINCCPYRDLVHVVNAPIMWSLQATYPGYFVKEHYHAPFLLTHAKEGVIESDLYRFVTSCN